MAVFQIYGTAGRGLDMTDLASWGLDSPARTQSLIYESDTYALFHIGNNPVFNRCAASFTRPSPTIYHINSIDFLKDDALVFEAMGLGINLTSDQIANGLLWILPTDGDDEFRGNDYRDVIFAGAGADHVYGNGGDDYLAGDGGNDTLYGNDGDDYLVGGDGWDELHGGAGNDIYVLDDPSELGTDEAGIDTIVVSSPFALNLTDGFENAIYGGAEGWTCRGNAAANGITGGEGADALQGLDGNDTLIGGLGADSLLGGEGSDFLVGGEGVDFMDGGLGDDVYAVDSPWDVIVDAGGYDTVLTATSLVLAGGLERLTFVGTGNFRGTGNELANLIVGGTGSDILKGMSGQDKLIGGAGKDYLYGGTGVDTLSGGSGYDFFVFDTKPSRTNWDRITDFSVAYDTIRVDNAIYTKAGPNGRLAASAFWSSKSGKAHDADDRFIYDQDGGQLYYDRDGTGSAAPIKIAQLKAGLALTFKDFYVI